MLRRASTLSDLPPHVLATVLRNADTWCDVVRVAHTCRALHQRITASRLCDGCVHSEPMDAADACAFWGHWRAQTHGNAPLKAVDMCARLGHATCVQFALCAPVDVSRGTNDVLCAACETGHLRIVDRLLRVPQVRVDLHCGVLKRAIDTGRADVLDRLMRDPVFRMDRRLDVDLMILDASHRGHGPIVARLFRDPRAHPQCEEVVLRSAIVFGYDDVLECVLKEGRRNIGLYASWALSNAYARGHWSLAMRLLRDKRVRAALRPWLHYAPMVGHVLARHWVVRWCAWWSAMWA